MLGDALLVSPVLQQGAGSVEAYFPPATWHSLWEDGHTVDARCGLWPPPWLLLPLPRAAACLCCLQLQARPAQSPSPPALSAPCRDGGKRVTLDAPLGEIPLHMKGGSVRGCSPRSGPAVATALAAATVLQPQTLPCDCPCDGHGPCAMPPSRRHRRCSCTSRQASPLPRPSAAR